MTSRGQGSWQPPRRGIYGKTKGLTAALLAPVDRARWGLWGICVSLKNKRASGQIYKVCDGHFSSPPSVPLNASMGGPWELSLGHMECISKANTHTWLQDEGPIKGAGVFYYDTHARKHTRWVSLLPLAVKTLPRPQSCTAATPPTRILLRHRSVWTVGALTNFKGRHLANCSGQKLDYIFQPIVDCLQKGNLSTSQRTMQQLLFDMADVPLLAYVIFFWCKASALILHSDLPFHRGTKVKCPQTFNEIKDREAPTSVLICSIVEPWKSKLLLLLLSGTIREKPIYFQLVLQCHSKY